ncbi:MAG: hypothetical protein U9Q07_02950, partial [Planctomycetota bacterium]|nr:hypothetical protein [Planctomycetota bacterium]
MTSLVFHFALCISIFFVAGCQKADEGPSLTVQMEQLTQENKELQTQIDRSNSENKQLEKRVEVLSSLPKDVRLENLYRLERIEIGRLSGFFDKDRDGKREKLIVYVTPVDEQGDAIKVTGAVNVQLWNLNKADGEALLGEWDIKPGELKTVWFKTVISANYRLTFDISNIVENFDEELTVRVAFTDYLSGKVLKDQQVIKPR